jgi:VanZ family protein
LRVLSLWGPVVLVLALIFWFSAMPDPGTPPGGMSDKSAHFIAYAALGGSLIRALASGRASGVTRRRLLVAMLLATLYGVSDELHQHFVPGRTPDWLDVLADAAGAVAGALGMAAAMWIYDRARVRLAQRDVHG